MGGALFWKITLFTFALNLFFLRAASSATPPADLYRVCQENGRSKFWAQLTVDADLMREHLKTLGLPAAHSRVAVIDTGFDMAHNRSRMQSPQLRTKKGFRNAANPSEDKDGHGTMVAGIIGASNGIGIAPDLSIDVYRVTSTDSGSCRLSDLSTAIRQACADGNRVINVSWGNIQDESGEKRNEQEEPQLLNELKKKGCLIVKSAGNSSYRKQFSSDNLDDVYLRAAAINETAYLSSFSSSGEISAPGSFVFTLESESTGHERETNLERRCDSDSGIFTNGTSFAAPITAAIAAEVMGVLEHIGKKRFGLLSPADQIKLVNRILKASELVHSVNGLRSVLIAERWARLPENADLLSVSDLSDLLVSDPSPVCSGGIPKFKKGEEAEHLYFLRKYLSSCSSSPEKMDQSAAALFSYYASWGDSAQALRWLSPIRLGYVAHYRPWFRNWLDSLWSLSLEKWKRRFRHQSSNTTAEEIQLRYGMDFDEALTLLPAYLSTRLHDLQGKEQAEQALSLFFHSYGTLNRFSRRDDRGSEQDLMRLSPVWKEALGVISAARLYRLVADWIKETTDFDKPWLVISSKELLMCYRLLNAILSEPALKMIHQKISRMEMILFARFNQTNRLTLERAAEEKPNAIKLTFRDDINDFFVGYLDPFYQRHRTEILEALSKGADGYDAARLNSFFLVHLLKGKNSGFSLEEREALLWSTLEAVSGGRGWNDVSTENWIFDVRADHLVAQYAREGLTDLFQSASSERKKGIRNRYEPIFERAESVDFYASELPWSYSEETQNDDSFWMNVEKSNPLISRESLFRTSVRVLKGIPLQTSSVKFALREAIAAVVPRAVALLVRAPAPFIFAETEFPRIPFVPSNRLVPVVYPSVRLNNQEDQGAILDDLLSDWADFIRASDVKAKTFSFLYREVFRSVSANEKARALLPPEGRWRYAMEALKRDLDHSPASTYGVGRDDLWSDVVALLSKR